MRAFTCIAFTCFFTGGLLLESSGAPDLFKHWETGLGGTAYEECTGLHPTDDGGCVVIGGAVSGASGNKTGSNYGDADYWIVKLDGEGNKDWEAVYGGSDTDYANGIASTPDGGYLIAGQSFSGVSGNKTNANFGNRDYWLVKADSNGNKLWEREFGSITNDFGSCITVSSNRYLLGGNSLGGVSGNKTTANFGGMDWWVVNVDSNGNKMWEAAFGGTSWEYLYNVQPTADGGFLLTGDSFSGVSGNKTTAKYGNYDGWIIKIDANGIKQWERDYGGTASDFFEVGVELDDGYLVGGSSYSGISGSKTSPNYGSADWWIVRLDMNGNQVWEATYGGTANDFLKALMPLDDGGFLLFGTSWSDAGGNKTVASFGESDYWLVKIDASGSVQWEMALGGGAEDYAVNALSQSSDGGYILGGYSESGISGNKTTSGFGSFDYWVIKVAYPSLTITPVGTTQVDVSWTPNTTGLILQETADLAASNGWSNASSGTNNPVSLTTTSPAMFYRLSTP
jgi:hypothetical protein